MPFTPPPSGIRERYRTRTAPKPNRPGTWNSLVVEVLDTVNDDRVVGTYERTYPSLYDTFEPFWQDGRPYALISPDYTSTSVMDLTTGEIVASEPEPELVTLASGKQVRRPGFCPTGFWVPDWWDIHDGSILPGDKYWDDATDVLPDGTFGLVAGCVWGDDWSWKVQYLDLSRIGDGVVGRDDRFGYVSLPAGLRLRQAARYANETDRIELAVAVDFARATGVAERWSLDDINRGEPPASPPGEAQAPTG